VTYILIYLLIGVLLVANALGRRKTAVWLAEFSPGVQTIGLVFLTAVAPLFILIAVIRRFFRGELKRNHTNEQQDESTTED
jgi:membrane protein implicated in regulation of membrane protease activity